MESTIVADLDFDLMLQLTLRKLLMVQFGCGTQEFLVICEDGKNTPSTINYKSLWGQCFFFHILQTNIWQMMRCKSRNVTTSAQNWINLLKCKILFLIALLVLESIHANGSDQLCLYQQIAPIWVSALFDDWQLKANTIIWIFWFL